MRPLRYSINVTLDGCCDHRLIVADDDLHRRAADNLLRADALLFGRVTYEMMEEAFRAPVDATDPFAVAIDAAKKYVVSDTLTEREIAWHPTTIVRGADFLRTVAELRARDGGYVYIYGSAGMVRSLLAADLVDELLLTVSPVFLGGGKTIFPDHGRALAFTLVSSVPAGTGALVCRYARAR